MLVSFRIDKDYEELMKRLAREGKRTKWLNEAVAQYANHYVVKNTPDDPAILEKLDEIKSLLLAMQDGHSNNKKVEEPKETKEEDTFFSLLSTGFNQGL